jgi:hypothetical protein
MKSVRVFTECSAIDTDHYDMLKKNIKAYVADSLTCEGPEGKIYEEDIAHWNTFGSDNGRTIKMTVIAPNSPEREKNLERITHELANLVLTHQYINHSVDLRIILAPMSHLYLIKERQAY